MGFYATKMCLRLIFENRLKLTFFIIGYYFLFVGNYPVPDSMKSEYCATTPSWAETTNDDKQDELPESLRN